MTFKSWFRSMPVWLRYAFTGALVYPAIVIVLLILSLITEPTKLYFIFETMQGIMIFPAYFLTNFFINKTFIVESYDVFRFYYLGLSLFFMILIGFFIGSIIAKIKMLN